MTLNILFSAPPKLWDRYKGALHQALTECGIEAQVSPDMPAQDTDYIVYAPNPSLTDFTPFTRTKAVLSLWAGVETIVSNTTLTQPLCRMVDDGLQLGMTEWVVGHVMRHHLGMDRHIHGLRGVWDQTTPPLARDRHITILGLGMLGAAAAQALAQLGFNVTGWSRSAKTIQGITCEHGPDGLQRALATAEICVLLLPNTMATQNTLNAQTLALMPKGAVILNPGRGALIDDDALLSALDTGQIGHATLDVFRIEPLPQDHPFWHRPNVTVTPHIAAETRADTASQVIADNIKRGETGQPLRHLVDRTTGY
ncbi:2-hydroxyacid dehydrogenase [Pacificibacter marinus]|uniref:Glyoxylate/hydroxypyruvate reductase A n=1 Tax=Pacificibacter marinus TaxID=658057 RepID=A0A1Y5SID8_9RHOB|nr:glyoxylate/hydroxypyruvate reductase A [Pacificibacter marinus]SEK52077.1 glyoxylate/hydroxypyruvate reductase A [Pacificibacter marinus]SLN38319.1 Glyoxylate/hydroxypyruvate reductase A [Pacificibacter marinus]